MSEEESEIAALLERKITNPDLRRFASRAEEAPRRVLIELDLPSPQVRFGESQAGGRKRVIRSVELSSEERDRTTERFEEVRGLLEDLGIEARALRHSGVILATVRPTDLRTAVGWAAVRRVHPNDERALRGAMG